MIRLVVIAANLLQVLLQALKAVQKMSNGCGLRGIAHVEW